MGESIDPNEYLKGNSLGESVRAELENEAILMAGGDKPVTNGDGGESSQIQPTRGRDGVDGILQDVAIAAAQQAFEGAKPWTNGQNAMGREQSKQQFGPIPEPHQEKPRR